MRKLLLAFCALIPLWAGAAIDAYQFDTPQQEEQFQKLIGELRCPKCQNQSIGDSNAPIAQDMRQKVHDLLKSGKDEQAVIDYLVERYGNFVHYDPPFNAATAVLWLGPLLAVMAGLLLLARQSRRSRRVDDQDLDADETRRLAQFLREEKADDNPNTNHKGDQ